MNYQVQLQKAIESGPAIQVKFHSLIRLQVAVSFLAVEFMYQSIPKAPILPGNPRTFDSR